eukprot:m.139482 g.139482  ORF g.139482 m.139482 type:complete len:75 (-) comp9993_c0_seq4:256-480(-)
MELRDLPLNLEQLDELVDFLDIDGDGRVNYQEFVHGRAAVINDRREVKPKSAWRSIEHRIAHLRAGVVQLSPPH